MHLTSAPPDRFLRGRGIVVAVGLLTLAVLTVGVGNAGGVTFDEFYYLPEARDWLQFGAPREFTYHPPLAKYLIALGVQAFGDGPLGWRIASTVTGAFAVAGTFVVGRRVLGSPWTALLAALLLATDGLFHTTARAAMLDVFTLGWFVAAALVLTRQDDTDSEADRRRWLLLASAGVGLALATKWATAPLTLVPWILWRRGCRTSSPTTGGAPFGRATLIMAGTVALLTYGLAWSPWLANYEHTAQAASCADEPPCGTGVREAAVGLVRLHADMLSSLSDQQINHGQRSLPWTMPVGWRPIVLFHDACSSPLLDPALCAPEAMPQRRAVSLVNPLAWWVFLLAIPALVSVGLPRRGSRGDRAAVAALAGWAVVQLPFLLLDRAQFLTWMTPAVPFLAIGAAKALELPGIAVARSAARALPGAVVGAAIGVLLPDRVPHQLALLAWMGWLTNALLVAARDVDGLGDSASVATVAGPPRRPLVVAAVTCVALFAAAAPVIRAAPLAHDDPRIRLVDRLRVTDGGTDG